MLLGIAAGLKITPANSAYTPPELAHQYQDSRARIILTAKANLDTVRSMFKLIGVSKEEGDARTIVMDEDAQVNWVKTNSKHAFESRAMRNY